jgi:hypothetical protein
MDGPSIPYGPSKFKNVTNKTKKRQTHESTPANSNRISQTAWSLETKLWGDDEHLKERLCPKNLGL